MIGYAVLLGFDTIIGTNGVLSVEKDGKLLEFFRVRSIFQPMQEGSCLLFDLDVKDTDGEREIKLANGNPVVIGEGVKVDTLPRQTIVTREDGSLILKIQQLEPDTSFLPVEGPLKDFFAQNPIEAVIRITGEFYAGSHRIKADSGAVPTEVILQPPQPSIATGSLRLTPFGISIQAKGLHSN